MRVVHTVCQSNGAYGRRLQAFVSAVCPARRFWRESRESAHLLVVLTGTVRIFGNETMCTIPLASPAARRHMTESVAFWRAPMGLLSFLGMRFSAVLWRRLADRGGWKDRQVIAAAPTTKATLYV